MAVRAIFQGHWRALETRWLAEFNKVKNKGEVAVVTAGQSLSEQLMRMGSDGVAGARFLPGFPALSKMLASSVTGASVPESQLTAMACLSGYRPESSRAAAAFFERLIEMGVSAENLDVIAHSTRGLHEEVLKTSGRYTVYSGMRNNLYPASPEKVYAEGPKQTDLFPVCMFYGFYDLNPAQRKYVKQLSATTDILWFSPVHPSHHWRETSARTMKFLTGLGVEETHRIDENKPLSSLAQFAENLLTGKTPGNARGIQLLLCGSGMGFSQTVINKIRVLKEKYSCKDYEIAVIATGDDAKQITEQMHLADIPSTMPLALKASELPSGNLLMELLQLKDNRFHHRDIERMLLTGAIRMEHTPDAASYSVRAAAAGARFGLESLRETGFPFAEALADYFQELPLEDSPQNYLTRIIQLLKLLTDNNLPAIFTDSVLHKRAFALTDDVAFDVFREMTAVALDASITLKDAARDGVSILSPEKARGIQRKAVILTGLEEGSFPRPIVNDPRLPVEIKKQLQLPSADTRWAEEGFLLRQLFEVAEKSISIICRHTDSSGKPMALSPFLAPLHNRDSTVDVTQQPASPADILVIPAAPPFLSSSSECQAERLGFNNEDPSPDSIHCGMIGDGFYNRQMLSATILESYARDPFAFLLNKVWRLEKSENFPVRSEPSPLERGKLVHSCVEVVLKDGSSADTTVRRICREKNLVSHLGSETLADIWIEHLVAGINSLTSMLADKDWDFVASEIHLTGEIAGEPAVGRVDLIFKNQKGEYILADLKTGRPKAITAGNLLRKNLYQLPFYRNLAIQNDLTPLAEATYIYMEGNGKITFKSLTGEELEGINGEFENRVLEILDFMVHGRFPENTKKDPGRDQW
ncbi:MAG: PD-(D/E)XK nuclease family protein [Candidatus Sabulitectum sp.]|nr:PD-(D/E)XK nuclease family protein [Candidatus Sabulitectum sp.]